MTLKKKLFFFTILSIQGILQNKAGVGIDGIYTKEFSIWAL